MAQGSDFVRSDVTGPGVTRALQEAVRAKKNVVLVPRYDSLGHILAFGYFLQDRGQPMPTDPEITWLAPGEYYVRKRVDTAGAQVKASLETKFMVPNRPNERLHMLELLALGSQGRLLLRTLFRISRAKTTGFVVQAELLRTIQGRESSRAVVRYDCAHGFLHRDMIPFEGRKRKVPLGDMEARDGMALAIDELGANLESWLDELGYEGVDTSLLHTPLAKEQLEKAKALLLELFDDPSLVSATESTLFQIKDQVDNVRRIFPPEGKVT